MRGVEFLLMNKADCDITDKVKGMKGSRWELISINSKFIKPLANNLSLNFSIRMEKLS